MPEKIRKKKKVMFYAKKGDLERTDYDDGSRTLSVPSDLEEAFEEQLNRFIEKFGREPRPEDPVFFDPDADTPKPLSKEKFNEELIEIMRKSGVDERLIKAYKKTGLIVTEENMDLLTPEELEQFERAMEAED